MIREASVNGVLRTILMIIGVIVVLRFIGQLMIAKRNQEEVRKLKSAQNKFNTDMKKSKLNFGKTEILNKNKTTSNASSTSTTIEDVEFEEI